MISKEFIESFEKVLDYYKIEKEDVFDIVRAISFSESEGTHPIRLKDLASSGVDYFSDIVSDKTNSKPLPDARLARVMVDSLSVILYVTNNKLFSTPDMISVLTASSDSVHKVCQKVVNYYNPSRANHLKFDKTSNYRTLEESERDMKRLLNTCVMTIDYTSLISTINKYADKMNSVFCYNNIYKINRNIKDIDLPVSIRADIDKRVKTDSFNFITDSVFNQKLYKSGFSCKEYCSYLLEVLFATACQNIISNLEEIEQSNNPLCCTVCIKLTRILNGASLNIPIDSSSIKIYTNAKTKVLKEYYEILFKTNGVVVNSDLTLSQLNVLYDCCSIIIKKIEKRGRL